MLPESTPTPHLYEGDHIIFFKDIKGKLLPLRGPVLENAQLLELAKAFCYPGTWHLSFLFLDSWIAFLLILYKAGLLSSLGT